MSGAEHRQARCKNLDSAGSASPYLVSVVGSAGAFNGLAALLGSLPTSCPAAVAVALHTRPGSVLIEALRYRSTLPVDWAQPDQVLRSARVYAAFPGTHLIVNPDKRLTVSDAPRIRHFRPSADWLLESGAASFGDRHVAIVLSGTMTDGATKLRAVKDHGGTVLVQSPGTCRFREMPTAAIDTGHVDQVLPVECMAAALAHLFGRRDARADDRVWQNPFGEFATN